MKINNILMVLVVLIVFLVSACEQAGNQTRKIIIFNRTELLQENLSEDILYIDSEVINELKNQTEVRVLVRVFNLADVDGVLSTLGDDFKLEEKLTSDPSFLGYLNEPGLKKLKKDFRVSAIFDQKVVYRPVIVDDMTMYDMMDILLINFNGKEQNGINAVSFFNNSYSSENTLFKDYFLQELNLLAKENSNMKDIKIRYWYMGDNGGSSIKLIYNEWLLDEEKYKLSDQIKAKLEAKWYVLQITLFP